MGLPRNSWVARSAAIGKNLLLGLLLATLFAAATRPVEVRPPMGADPIGVVLVTVRPNHGPPSQDAPGKEPPQAPVICAAIPVHAWRPVLPEPLIVLAVLPLGTDRCRPLVSNRVFARRWEPRSPRTYLPATPENPRSPPA